MTMGQPIATIGLSEAKTNFSSLTAKANSTGVPITVLKNNRPWVEIRPLAVQEKCDVLPKETLEAIVEVNEMKNDPYHERFTTAESLFKSLGI